MLTGRAQRLLSLIVVCLIGAALWWLPTWRTMSPSAMSQESVLDDDVRHEILVYESPGASIATLDPLIGRSGRNHLREVVDARQWMAALSERRWDAVAVFRDPRSQDAAVEENLERAGYVVLNSDDRAVFALPADRVTLEPLNP